jgi:hypothetical protein
MLSFEGEERAFARREKDDEQPVKAMVAAVARKWRRFNEGVMSRYGQLMREY